MIEARSPALRAGEAQGNGRAVSRVLAERKGLGAAESRRHPGPFCLPAPSQLCDDQLCAAVFIPGDPAWPHHGPGAEPGQEHRGLPAVAVGHPVRHEHEHRPGHQNQPLHRGPAGEAASATPSVCPWQPAPSGGAQRDLRGRVPVTPSQGLACRVLRLPGWLSVCSVLSQRRPQNWGGAAQVGR